MNANALHKDEIRYWCLIFAWMALAAETTHYFIFGNSFYVSTLLEQEGVVGILVQLSFPLAAGALFLLFAGWLRFTIKKYIVSLSIGLILVAWLFSAHPEKYGIFSVPYILAIPLGAWLLVDSLVRLFNTESSGREFVSNAYPFLWIVIGGIAMATATHALLRVTAVIFPLTHDFELFHVDTIFGNLAASVASTSNGMPVWFQSVTITVYSLLAILFFPVVALLIRENKVRTLHAWRYMAIPFFVAVICYAWLPATGPIFVFGQNNFPANIPPLDQVQFDLASVPAAFRNAMPSMHLSGALWIAMALAALRRKFLFALSIFFVLATAWATLALGQHYVIDLVVALPFAASLGLWLMNPPRWRTAPRWQHGLQWAAGATFLLWMSLLRLAPGWLHAHPLGVQVLAAWSVVAGLALFALQLTCVWREEDTNEILLAARDPALVPAPFAAPALLPPELIGRRWLVWIFFFSGFAGLVYEVVYAKALGVTFGGTALAANTVLMTYMGGMALGAWLGGILAERSSRPLYLYALFEAAIGVYAAFTPMLFDGIQNLYVALALDTPPDAPTLTALRMALGAVVLGVPTVLMGATLPLVFQCLRSLGIPTGRAIAPLYGANVLGAAAGALVAGYALLPAVGRQGGTLLAAVISLMVALFVIDKIKRTPGLFERDRSNSTHIDDLAPAVAPARGQGPAALGVLMVGGVITLALEVVFMHLLAVVAGNSVYAFGLMLATFLLGLGLGSTVGERLMLRFERATLVQWAQCGIALAILLTAFVWDGLADYMGSFGYAMQQGVFLDFGAREMVRALVCALAMLPPAFFIGMSYPAAMGLAADWLAARRFGGQAARGVGLASAANTLGNIAGVLLAAFWWLPAYGSRNVLMGLAVAAVLLAALMAWTAAPGRRTFTRFAPAASMAAALLLFPAHWNYTALSQGGNVYFYLQQWGEVIDHAESVEGGLTTVAKAQQGDTAHLTLLTNGKFQGNNAEGGEMVAQESFALMPLLHTTARDRALAIGYGTGMTARVLQDQGFAKLDVVELSRDIVTMADKYFANINAQISSHPSVTMHYTDGRNYLLTQSRQFDLISLEISSIWFAGAANLYNREFYELAAKRLRPQGVLQQWVQLHHMRPMDFLYIMGSVRSVFKHVWLYVSGGQGIIVASNSDAAVDNHAALDKLVTGHTISTLDVADLPGRLVAGPAQVDAMLQRFDPTMSFFVSTDKNLYLEYATPKGNAVTIDTVPVLIDMLKGKQ